MKPISRRRFLQSTAAAGVSLSALPRSAAQAPAPAPAHKLNLAAFGAGGIAKFNLKALMDTGGLNLVAAADVDDQKSAWLKEAYPDTRIYKDWRELMAQEADRLDAACVCTPDHMHAPIGVTAMKAGLHLYGQKPLAHSLYETRRMAEIAQETGVATQMGIQLASSTPERMAVQMIHDGVVGKIKEVHLFCHKTWGDNRPKPDRVDPIPESLDWDLWCGVAPKTSYLNRYYHPANWRSRVDYGCGTLGDMGAHIFSPLFGALGVRAPLSVVALGDPANDHSWGVNEKYTFVFSGNERTAGDTLTVHWHGGSFLPPEDLRAVFGERMPQQGSIFVGTDGYLLQPHQSTPMPYPREKFTGYRHPRVEPRNHYADFVDAARGEDVQPIAEFARYGGPLTEAILLGALSSRFPGQRLEWDAENLKVTNFPAANPLLRRAYRKGWEVDGLS